MSTWCIHILVWTWPLLGKNCFILSDRSYFHITDNLLIAVYTFASHVLMSLSIEQTLFRRCVNLSIILGEPTFSAEKSPLWLKHMYFILSTFIWKLMSPAAYSRWCSRDSAWASVFASSAMSSAKFVSVIVCAGYHLLLAFTSVKPFSLIKSIITSEPDWFCFTLEKKGGVATNFCCLAFKRLPSTLAIYQIWKL